MILYKYDSKSDLYEQYYINGEDVSYDRRFLNGQSVKPVRRWTHTLNELGWTSSTNYFNHLKKLGYKEVSKYHARKRQSQIS